ncbi:MAG: bifunctional methylenetetrahydrofolate dehydrogenase/methenyltetrahydrofolate cyclohydrolase FolD [Alphaproteobacteria bacterium]|nr:MAG: bifunctional methylenetetrahydrofolate dehydrogenase/methenyltetrahydrofolate cyclohydrolase FolD [Alphaproteobacteria bacterium]
MTAQLIDGKTFAAHLRTQLAQDVQRLIQQHKVTPCVSFVLLGDDPASHYYIQSKAKTCAEVGIISRDFKLPASTSQEELLHLLTTLNNDPTVHGILVQLPLPAHLNEREVINAISPHKDVDGFHPFNAGKLATGEDAPVACTPLGSLMLIHHALGTNLEGKHAVVIGRSNIVGKPMAQLLIAQSCTVTLCHSRTRDIASVVAQGDIVVAAVGRPELVKASWIKEGACVIDVGINRVQLPDGSSRLVGDVAFEEVRQKAGWITPVPGGVGPMTIACLMRNTVAAAYEACGILLDR